MGAETPAAARAGMRGETKGEEDTQGKRGQKEMDGPALMNGIPH